MANEAGVDSNDIRAVERILLRLEGGLLNTEVECCILFEVQTLSSWIIKFRGSGTIVNNCELVFPGLDVQATISFKSHTAFWAVANGGEGGFADALAKGTVTISGHENAIDIFKRKLFRSMATREPTVSPMPQRLRGLSSGESPLKSGWLLKKRDLFSGWRCRYFVVYMGRVDYFIDQHDMQTRGTVPLYGAEVSAARKMTINGVSDHWGMTVDLSKVEPKQKEKSFKLASELTGEEGMVEATTWVQVFSIASKRGQDIRAVQLPGPHRSSIPSGSKTAISSSAANTIPSSNQRGLQSSANNTVTVSKSPSSSKLATAADSTKATVAAVMAAASETTTSSVTLPFPAIVVALIVLFFAGWITGGGVQYSALNLGLIVVVVLFASIMLVTYSSILFPNAASTSTKQRSDSIDNDTEVVLRSKGRTNNSRIRSNSEGEKDGIKTRRYSDASDEDSQ